MKNSNFILSLVVSVLVCSNIVAQVGVATNQPEGILDLQNSGSAGFVFPRVALTSTLVEAPVTNPNGGSLVEGTVVFNTNSTATGANDVTPGIYVWEGSRWNPQFLREDTVKFEQSPLDFRTTTGSTSYNNGSSDWVEVPGLGSGSTFTPKYTGTYRIEANFNFGSGEVKTPSSGNISMSTMEGLFRLTFDGSNDVIYTHSYGMYNDALGGGTYTEEYRHETSIVKYVTLTAGQTYNFMVEIDIFVGDGYVDNGNSGTGRGHVGVGIPCTLEFSFIE
ncbi:hypothetical protein [Luteirhabdus pelagi]|uniref:hypothetical protein n=1 Tax=Luteirhabdus pelagi TaxID=2792783 RepID=UPI001939470C|nr:hypothetical protein [Luteirhabdus pelagi]